MLRWFELSEKGVYNILDDVYYGGLFAYLTAYLMKLIKVSFLIHEYLDLSLG